MPDNRILVDTHILVYAYDRSEPMWSAQRSTVERISQGGGEKALRSYEKRLEKALYSSVLTIMNRLPENFEARTAIL